jgi:branched-chain amino acid transport system ATP-binding protein
MSNEIELSVNNLSVWHGKAQVLFDIGFEIARGECVALMGRNGAGKSTTLKSILNLNQQRSGQVVFRGEQIHDSSTHDIVQRGLGYVPEDRRIFTELTVLENLSVGTQAPRQGAHHWTVPQVFELFPNLGQMPTRLGAQMSGGEQQMLTVARTLMGNPYCVLLDEPSEGVAPLVVEQMAKTINRLKEKGLTVVLSEQNIHFARQVADRAIVLEKGVVQLLCGMDELMHNEQWRQQYLGA